MAAEGDQEKALERLVDEYSSHGNHSSLEAFFKHLDLDGNGTIEATELRSGLEEMGVVLSLESVRKLMESVGANSDDTLSFEQFTKIVGQRSHWERALQVELDELCKEAKQKEKQDTKRAIELYEEVLRRNSKHVQALSSLGAIRHSFNQFEQARECYDRVLSIEPTRAATVYNLGRLAHDMGLLDDAAARYEKVLTLDADKAITCNALAFLGLILQDKRGELDRARQCYQQSLARSPQHVRTLCHQCALLVLSGNTEAAASQHAQLTQLDAKHALQQCPYETTLSLSSFSFTRHESAATSGSGAAGLASPPRTGSGSKDTSKGKASWLKRIGSSFKSMSLESHLKKREDRSLHGSEGDGSSHGQSPLRSRSVHNSPKADGDGSNHGHV